MTGMAFSAGALDANRAGRLGPDQLHDLQASVRYRRRGLVGHFLHSGDAFAQDVASGQVASVEGAITKKILQSSCGGDGEAPPSYRIWVASRQAGNQQFKSGAEFYDSAPDGGFVRLFYLPKSKWCRRGAGGALVSGSCRARGHRCHGCLDGHRRVGRRRRIDAHHQRPGAESAALANLIFGPGSQSAQARLGLALSQCPRCWLACMMPNWLAAAATRRAAQMATQGRARQFAGYAVHQFGGQELASRQ